MSTWITRLETVGEGVRVGVKDAIDVQDVPTTMGCAGIADDAEPAVADASVVAQARRAGARIVGKTNLHELCYGATGINQWFGTPKNPLNPMWVPGGSSSGAAVAVATDEADVSFGTDTGGSIRVPAACCGVAGLKTTWGRVARSGVAALAPSFDTVGPIACNVAGIVAGMALIEPGFTVTTPATLVGRVRIAGVHPAIEASVDEVLSVSGVAVVEVELAGFQATYLDFGVIAGAEVSKTFGHLVTSHPERIGDLVAERLRNAMGTDPRQVPRARARQLRWKNELAEIFTQVQLLALPTLPGRPMTLESALQSPSMGISPMSLLTVPFSLAGVPALSLPISHSANLPVSLQLVAPIGGEELACGTGALIEAASATIVRQN